MADNRRRPDSRTSKQDEAPPEAIRDLMEDDLTDAKPIPASAGRERRNQPASRAFDSPVFLTDAPRPRSLTARSIGA